MNKFELELRFIGYSSMIINLLRKPPKEAAMLHLSDQLIMSAISAALNYSESMSGESDRDFVHKLGISLKELRESYCCLRIMLKTGLLEPSDQTKMAENEANELISILVASITTMKKNMLASKHK